MPQAAGQDVSAADVYLGETLFADTCASCHGAAGAGGGVGPRLAGSGLAADQVAQVIASGRGVMPGALVSGTDAASVAAYVASIAAGK